MPGIFEKLRGDRGKQEAVAALKHLRSSIDEFHRLRMLNQCALRGTDKTCKYKPEEMRIRLAVLRDPQMEQRFQDEHMKLMRLLYQRDPSQEELQAGPPSGEALGLLPALLAVGLPVTVIGAAWGLSSITGYLSERERMARGQQEAARTTSNLLLGALVVGGVGASAFGAYKLWKWAKGKPKKKELKGAESPPELTEAEEEAEEEEE